MVYGSIVEPRPIFEPIIMGLSGLILKQLSFEVGTALAYTEIQETQLIKNTLIVLYILFVLGLSVAARAEILPPKISVATK